MKKFAAIALCTLLIPLALSAQAPIIYESVTDHYRVYSEVSVEHAETTGLTLEALFELYNSVFRFEKEGLMPKLKVRILADKERYDDYLRRIISQTRDDFIYLHYSDREKSELVGFQTDDEFFQISLNHQSFIQFLRFFVPHPPLWMREGFAVFFEKAGYDPITGSWFYKENLAWLDTLKTLAENEGAGLLPLKTILGMNVDQARERIEVFYPQTWGIVSFLINSPNREHNRLLWDSISALRPDGSLEQNNDRVYNRAVKWYEEEQLTRDFLFYLEERKSFRSLVQEGIDLYSGTELDRSEAAFLSAMDIEEENFIPYYYMGLINYSRKNYSVADHYYKTALDLGAQPSLIHYAMGVNSFADNRFEDAANSLKTAGEVDPSYKEKAEELLRRIRK